MRGSVTRRGKRSWRLKYDVERDAGARQIRYVTVKGTRKDAEAELARLVHEVHTGTHVDPSKITVGEWLHKWLARQKLSPRSAETYDVIVARLAAAIGDIRLQKLRPIHLHEMQLLRRDGSPVATRTDRHARRVLKAALAVAAEIELVSRNVAASGRAPAAEEGEVEILGPAEITATLEALRESDLFPIVSLALATGMRRGELLALRWQDVDLGAGAVKVEQSLEHTKAQGYRFKTPKTKYSRRTVSLPSSTVDMLRDHRLAQLELRMALGMGKPPDDALVFCRLDGQPLPPNHLTHRWCQAVKSKWKFHALRHTHASALIAAGLDVVRVSRRLGHSSPTITLRTYAHLFEVGPDKAAAEAIEKLLGANRVPNGGHSL
jgi:integrase